MKALLARYMFFPLLALAGVIFAYRLIHIPSRTETAIFCIGFFMIPTLKYPKLGVYYLFCLPLFIPMFRRMYYLISDRPTLDYLLLISDGVMGGLLVALILLWILNKERSKDAMSIMILVYTALLLLKVFVGNQGTMVEGLYGFKFNGLYVCFFFGASYIITTFKETRRVYFYTSVLLFITALYALKQILFGFSDFEQKWLDSIQFTTLRIEGVVRPFSTYLSPAAMSDGMSILFMLGVYWIIAKGRHMVPFGILMVGACITPLLIATVRTNWLAVMAGVFFYGFFLRIQTTWVKVALMVIMALGIIGYSVKGAGDSSGAAQFAGISTQSGGKKNLADIMIRNRTAALTNPLAEYSVQKRVTTWTGIYYTSFTFPFGKGQGTTGYAHSYYFQVLGEIGYPGLLIFLALLIMGFYRGFKILALSKDPDVLELTRMMLTILFIITILNLTGTHLHTPPGDIFFWFTMGAISRTYRQTRDEALAKKNADAAGEGEGAQNPSGTADAANPVAGGALA